MQTGRAGSEIPGNPMVAAGPNGANPHASVSNRPLQAGDLLVIDFGAALRGLLCRHHPHLCRRRAAAELARIHQVTLEANAAGRAAARPGIPAGDVDRAARAVIEAAGYGPYFTHRTGHGLGSEPHEEPYIYAENPLLLEPGMVFTVEPGIYLPGQAGARVEDDVVITATGAESLSTHAPRVSCGRINEETTEREDSGQDTSRVLRSSTGTWSLEWTSQPLKNKSCDLDFARIVEEHGSPCATHCGSRFAATADGTPRRQCHPWTALPATAWRMSIAEPFEMPGWERGTARLALLEGEAEIDIPCIALPGTPACDLEAEIIDIGSGRAG